MKNRVLILSIVYCLFACSGEEVNNRFCNLPARLNVENVQQAPVLFTACESMGEYCYITSDGQRLLFTDATNHTSFINLTAIGGYSGYYLGLSGFIVGRLTIPEMGESNTSVVCYDRACSNCYQSYNWPHLQPQRHRQHLRRPRRSFSLPLPRQLHRQRIGHQQRKVTPRKNAMSRVDHRDA